MQTYTLTIVAKDGGQPQRSSTASVTIHVVDDPSSLPPQWQPVNGVAIDDLGNVSVREDAAVNTLITNQGSLRLMAVSRQGPVQYFLTSNGQPELNGGSDFTIPSPNPFNNTSLMPIATYRNIDASTVSSYVLRCRAFVSFLLLYYKLSAFHACTVLVNPEIEAQASASRIASDVFRALPLVL